MDDLPREHALCAYTILDRDLMEVSDTQRDPRFYNNPLVVQDPHIRFYAGHPLTTSSHHSVGTLCVIDQQPRSLNEVQRTALRVLAQQVVHHLEYRAQNHRLVDSLALTEELSRVGVFEFDLLNHQLAFTSSLSELFGLPATLTKIDVSDVIALIHPEDFPRVKEYMIHRIAYHDQFSFDYRIVSPTTGKIVHMRCLGNILQDQHQNPYQLSGVIRDITDEKRKEAVIETQRYQLNQINQELDSLVYRVSHDLRAPIATALGLLYLSQQESEIVAIQPLLRLTERTLRKQDRFITNILHYALNHRAAVEENTIDFQSIIDNLVAQHCPVDSPVEVLVSVQQPTTFITDKARLTIALSNIIANAFHYAKPQRAQPYIEIAVQVTQSEAWIRIADNGIGIGKPHVGQIFDMFYRATDQSSGSGIGLYITKAAIQKLSGSIQLQSIEGVGSTFEVTLPNKSQ